jgi:hypothetical protein
VSAREDFVRAVGERLLHVTARSNMPGIHRHGLMPPAELARLCGVDPESLLLRRDRLQLTLPDGTTAKLNHQLPIVHGLAAANRIVDGHDAASWARQLDHRVFLWPEKRGISFAASVARDTDAASLWIDSGALFDAMVGDIWLAPINSGNFLQGGAQARRGDWLYCAAKEGIDASRRNRVKRGLMKGMDTIREVSVTRLVPSELLNPTRQEAL